MCPVLLEEAIKDRIKKGKKPKAIIPVHLYGMPAQMDRITSIANNYEIPIIEDAAEALGSELNGIKMGNYGEMAILSFNGNKIITTSGGGALVSSTTGYIQKARFLATQARDPAPHYQHTHIGYNYRMSNICAGIGRGQMEVIDERVEQRRSNFSFYQAAFSKISAISFLEEPDGFFSNRWLTTISIDASCGVTSEDIRLALDKENIETRPLWKPMHMQPVFNECPKYLNMQSETLFNKGLCIPSGSNLTAADKDRVVNAIAQIFNK
jgi:dTDP-4-amino-4,6-dideoxygalactose transaminase